MEKVTDPEVPVLSVTDLGIIRNVGFEGENVAITITPTYTGCPAMDVIAIGIRMALISHGVKKVLIEPQLSPA